MRIQPKHIRLATSTLHDWPLLLDSRMYTRRGLSCAVRAHGSLVQLDGCANCCGPLPLLALASPHLFAQRFDVLAVQIG